MGIINSAVTHIENLFFKLAQVVLVILMLFSTLDTMLRYLFSQSFGGGYEIIAQYMMPFLVYLSIGYVMRTGGHIRVSLLTDALSHKAQELLMLISNSLSIIFFGCITYASFFKVLKAYEIGERSSNVLAYVLWPAYGVVLVGMGLITIRLIILVIKRKNPYKDPESNEI